MEAERPKSDLADARGPFSSVTLAPVRPTQPVLDSGALVGGAKLIQPHASDVYAVVLTAHREVEPLPRTNCTASHTDEGTAQLGSVRVANWNRSPDLPASQQPDHIVDVAVSRKSKNEAGGHERQLETRKGRVAGARTITGEVPTYPVIPVLNVFRLSGSQGQIQGGVGETDPF
jgi:hypothetical protein